MATATAAGKPKKKRTKTGKIKGYCFADGSRLGGDANRVAQRFAYLRRKHKVRELMPQHLIQDIQKCPRSYLRQYFTLDAKQAILKCWTEEARHLIRSLEIVVQVRPNKIERIRAEVSVREMQNIEVGGVISYGYIQATEVWSDDQMTADELSAMRRELREFMARWRKYGQQLAPLFAVIRRFL